MAGAPFGLGGPPFGPYSGLRRSVIDPVTGRALVTSEPTGEVAQRSTLLPVGRDDGGRLVPAVPGLLADAPQHIASAVTLPRDAWRGDVETTPTRMSREEGMRVADLAGLAMTGGVGGVMKEASETALGSGPIRAYHGSPHSFDRFDVSKLGTGEGNQGFGRGLYFAEDERIARTYRDDLSAVPVLKFDGDAAGLEASRPRNARDLAAFGFNTGHGHLDAGLDNIRMMVEFDPSLASFADEAAQYLRDGRVSRGPRSKGHMYEVAIDADPARMLDWDLPLADQGKAVRGFAGERMADPAAREAVEERARRRLGGPQSPTGFDLYAGLGGYDEAARDALSGSMREVGIPGIRYMDSGSRGFDAGTQTRQYVTFGDDIVSILRKYGLAGAAGGAAAAGALVSSDDAQAAPSQGNPPVSASPFGFGPQMSPEDLARLFQAQAGAGAGSPPLSVQPAPFGFGASPMPLSIAPGDLAPGRMPGSVPVAMDEAETQALERATGMVPPAAARRAGGAPAARAQRAPMAPDGSVRVPLPPARPPEFGQVTRADMPAQGAQPIMAQGAAPEEGPSVLDRIMGGIRSSDGLLTSLGIGLMSTRGFGQGLAAGFSNHQQGEGRRAASRLAQAEYGLKASKLAREQNTENQTAKFIQSKIPGMSSEQAQALAGNTSFVNEILKGVVPPQEVYRQFTDERGNIWNQNTRTGQQTVALQAKDNAEKDEGAKITAQMEARRIQAPRLGLVEGSPEWRSFVGTGKIGREQDIQAADRKVIYAAEDELPILDSTLETLSRARSLNRQTFTGSGANLRAQIGTRLPDWAVPDGIADPKTAEATREFGQIMSMEAIKSMSQTLKGATTDRELDRFVEILSDPTTPPDIRERTIDRMATLAQRQRDLAQSRITELRDGTYYKRGGGTSSPQPTTAAPASPQTPARDPIAMARDALAKGASRDAVLKRLRDAGIDPAGL